MSRRGVVLFVAMGIIWGIPYLLIKVAVRDMSPACLVFGRTVIGAAVLVPLAASRSELRPVLARWRAVVAYTVVELAVPWVLLSTAEQRLPSSLTGLLIAAVPLVALPVGLGLDRLGGGAGRRRPPVRDAVTRRGLAGLALGLCGVAALVGFDLGGGDAGSAALLVAVVAGYALGPAIVDRWLGGVPVLGVVAASLVLCSAGYAPFALTELPAHVDARAAASVVTLGLVCTALAFVVFFALIAEVGAVRATVITYLNPAVAVVLGATFLHEAVGVATVAGFALVLLGSWLATHRRQARATVESS